MEHGAQGFFVSFDPSPRVGFRDSVLVPLALWPALPDGGAPESPSLLFPPHPGGLTARGFLAGPHTSKSLSGFSFAVTGRGGFFGNDAEPNIEPEEKSRSVCPRRDTSAVQSASFPFNFAFRAVRSAEKTNRRNEMNTTKKTEARP